MKHYLSILKDTICAKWENPALSDYNGKTYTFAHIATDIKRIHAIFAGLGVQPGDKVAVAAKNSAHWAITFLATTTYRAVVVPILNDFLPADIATLTDHSESVVLFTEAKMWDNMPLDMMPKLKAAVNTDDFSALYSREEGLLESIIEENNKHIPAVYSSSLKHEVADYTIGDLDDLAVINYTSGTTSSPKGVMLTSRNISSNIEFALNRIPVKEGDTLMSMLPMAHMYGMAFEFIYPLCGGAHVYFLGKTPTPTILLKALSDIKPYLFITVPLVLEKIFKGKVMPTLNKPVMRIATAIPGVRNLIYGKVRKTLLNTFGGNITSIVVGGAAISRPVEDVMRKVGLPYTVGYGMTECAPLIGYEPWETFCVGSAGRAVDNVDVRIDSPNPAKVVGEIQVKGANVMLGYYKNPEATAAVFTEDGYLRTGDLGIIDAQGNIFIRGRSKCMILTANGQNIYPEEIESKLNSMPYVAESLIVERDKRLYALIAVAENTDGMSKEEILATMEQNRKDLNQQLPAYSQVLGVEIMEEGFEHTPKRSIKRFLYK
ncbi:MAG: AMP-binding protein [Alistipes sp.]|nr:AMP-binding protein [Alistipes sp.]